MGLSFRLSTWRQAQLMILCLLVSGTCSVVTVLQPPVIMSALGQAAVLQSKLIVSPDEKLLSQPILYWDYLKGNSDIERLWPSLGRYESRVTLMDSDKDSSNKSVLLKDVQWADSGEYRCKLSITTERRRRFRTQGTPTLLVVYDSMTFNLTAHNDSLLGCEVKVIRNPDVVLSIFYNGSKLETGDSGPGEAAAALPYVTLSKIVHVRDGGNYECQLHLNADLITKSSFHYQSATDEARGASKTVSVSVLPTAAGVKVFPEPWALYVCILMVPITVLLLLITGEKCRSSVCQHLAGEERLSFGDL